MDDLIISASSDSNNSAPRSSFHSLVTGSMRKSTCGAVALCFIKGLNELGFGIQGSFAALMLEPFPTRNKVEFLANPTKIYSFYWPSEMNPHSPGKPTIHQSSIAKNPILNLGTLEFPPIVNRKNKILLGDLIAGPSFSSSSTMSLKTPINKDFPAE
ncbi:hypothetical protein PS1_019681 [Malus domestica]